MHIFAFADDTDIIARIKETLKQTFLSLEAEANKMHLAITRIKSNIYAAATRGLLATDHVILNHGQVTWTTPELAPPLLTTKPHQREDVSALDRFNVHRCPTQRVFSGTGLELVTRQATVRYLYHSATAALLYKLTENHKYCKEPLPAPGNRSNETRDREKDLATTKGEKGRNGGREGERGGRKNRGGEKKTWLDDGW
ncbi:uncharacterized protein TNCV_2428721 [Trichonephila clavipes]|nr:uncharacterized protein TNCV_2428721 [Trichonephila clavipes]